MEEHSVPVACTLGPEAARDQLLEWEDIRERAHSIRALPNGIQMRFSTEFESAIVDLAERESKCCGFLDITTTVVGAELVLEVGSDNPQALPVVAMIAGVPVAQERDDS